MASTTIVFAPVTKMTKYRMHNVDLAKSLGWAWKQEGTFTDLFTKGNQTLTVTWHGGELGSMVHLVNGKQNPDYTFGAAKGAKLQRLSNALGQPMPLDGPGSKYKGLKLVELEAKGAKTFKVKGEPAQKAAPKPAQKATPKPAQKATPKPSVSLGKDAEARQATRDAAHMAELA